DALSTALNEWRAAVGPPNVSIEPGARQEAGTATFNTSASVLAILRPSTRDAVLLDLGRLNRIVDFSEPLAYVTLEPGVTQRQLYDFLRAQQSNLWMD